MTGQIFVVTQSRENVKMGSVGVHAVNDEQLKPIAATLLQEFRDAELKRNTNLAELHLDQSTLERFESDLDALQPAGLAANVAEVRRLKKECAQRLERLKADEKSKVAGNLPGNAALAARLFAILPKPAVKTDADGRFTLRAKPKAWLLANSQRKVGSENENYVWAASVPAADGLIVISNDCLLEEPDGLRNFLGSISGITAGPLPIPTAAADPEIVAWTATSLPTATAAVLSAVAQAEAEVKAAAKPAAEKRMAWTGSAMRRAGFTDDQINRALVHGGTVVAWGENDNGQCNVPAGLSGVVAIAAQGAKSIALRQDGTVVSWGVLDGEAVGLNGVVSIAAGIHNAVALRHDGSVVAWGASYDNKWKVPAGLRDAVAISAGTDRTVALKRDGTVTAWGTFDMAFSGVHGIVAIAAGGDKHTVALLNDGTVVADDYLNEDYKLHVPTGLTGVVAIATGDEHAVALKNDGTVVARGENYSGQCNVPAGLSGVVAIAAGYNHTVALKSDGTVVAWGANDQGQCDVPAGLTGVVAIAAGFRYTIALQAR